MLPEPPPGPWAWHVHHDTLVERLCAPDPFTDPLAERVRYIRKNKPANEVPTRLRLLKLVRDQTACDAAEKRRNMAFDLTRRVIPWDEWDAAMEALHDIECLNCPWDGHTIFPQSRGAL